MEEKKKEKDAMTKTSVKNTGVKNTGAKKPDSVPEKFWDAEKGEVRLEQLLKSYAELERLLSAKATEMAEMAELVEAKKIEGVEDKTSDRGSHPGRPEDYEITLAHDFFEQDGELNSKLHEAGFSNSQVQLVYDLAVERLLPVARSVYENMQQVMMEERLVAHFGGRERWEEIRDQLAMWTERHLPKGAQEALSSSYEGILLLYRLMAGEGEKAVLKEGSGEEVMDEKALRRMVRDPRYWREGDKKVISSVEKGFQRLYPE